MANAIAKFKMRAGRTSGCKKANEGHGSWWEQKPDSQQIKLTSEVTLLPNTIYF